MRYDKVAAVAVILAIAITATFYPRLPDKIPVHWGLTGKPDRWGPPITIFLPPVIALIANFYTMADEKYDLRAKTRKVRLVTGGLMALQTFSLWWVLTKIAE